MWILPADGRFLERALALARDAAAFASPNPAVGCVLVRGEQVLGEGAHVYDRRDHAEIAALRAANGSGHDVRGATAYVTLEPCAHHGRTGPCADALVAAGIARCVVATLDPNPAVSGKGLRTLRAGGVEVAVADATTPLAREARRLNDAFAFAIQHGRPLVTLKSALSADGYLAPPRRARGDRKPFWLTGPAARADVQALRHRTDCLVTGIGTVLADDPSLTDRTGESRRRPLLRVVLDAELRTPPESHLVRSAEEAANAESNDLLILASDRATLGRRTALEQRGAEVLTLPVSAKGFDLGEVLALLQSRAIRSVLVEAGSRVNASFLSSDLVDRLVLYFAPVELGPGALPFAEGQLDPAAWQSRLTEIRRVPFPHGEAEDLRITGYLHDPWESMNRSRDPG